MTKSVFLYVSLISTMLLSCSKSNDDSNVLPPAAPKLSRFVVGTPLPGGGIDTIINTTYTWDAANRCTRIVSNAVSFGNVLYVDNYYNGSDTLISSRKLVESNDPSNISWEYFGYDASGKMNYDSTVEDALNNPSVLIYKYSGSAGVYSLNLFFDVVGANANIKTNYQQVYDGNGNVVSEIDSNYMYNNSVGTYYFINKSTSTVSFDNKPNPFYRVMPHRLVLSEPENILREDFFPFFGIAEKNNCIDQQSIKVSPTTGTSSDRNIINYQYNSDGYPTEMTFTNQGSGDVYKGYYFYQ